MARSHKSKNKRIKLFCLGSGSVSQRSDGLIRNLYAAFCPCTSSPLWGFLCFTPHSGPGAFFLPHRAHRAHRTSACSSPPTDCTMTHAMIGQLAAFQTLTTGLYKNGNNLLGASDSATNNSALLPLFPPQALLKLPSHLSQSEEVLKFFETTLEDLNPPTE